MPRLSAAAAAKSMVFMVSLLVCPRRRGACSLTGEKMHADRSRRYEAIHRSEAIYGSEAAGLSRLCGLVDQARAIGSHKLPTFRMIESSSCGLADGARSPARAELNRADSHGDSDPTRDAPGPAPVGLGHPEFSTAC